MASRGYSWRRAALVFAFLAGLLGWRALAEVKDRYVFTINHTQSLPHWAFVVDRKAEPKRGDFVYFLPPENPYYDQIGFVKIVAGVSGDQVHRDGRAFFVNGQSVGHAKETSQAGDPLQPGPEGVIPPQHYYVFTPHRDSYDSRYDDIGWIGRDRLVGVAKPIL